MLDQISKTISQQMDKAVDNLRGEFAKVRSGRATPALLDTIRVDYYGTVTPLNQMAAVSAPEARLLVVQPWDQSALSEIEKAIQKSDLGLAPQNDGKIIRIPFPALTEERRKELVKLASKFAEESRIAVRNARRHGMEDLKKAEKEKKISEDDLKRGQHQVQDLTDSYIKKVDGVLEAKSKEILEI